MEEFASNEAIQCTEVFEYAQALKDNPHFCLSHFQVSLNIHCVECAGLVAFSLNLTELY